MIEELEYRLETERLWSWIPWYTYSDPTVAKSSLEHFRELHPDNKFRIVLTRQTSEVLAW